MQMKEAQLLREEWERNHKGEKCSHPNLDKEYELGAQTGDYVCTVCGECGWGRDWPERESQN